MVVYLAKTSEEIFKINFLMFSLFDFISLKFRFYLSDLEHDEDFWKLFFIRLY